MYSVRHECRSTVIVVVQILSWCKCPPKHLYHKGWIIKSVEGVVKRHEICVAWDSEWICEKVEEKNILSTSLTLELCKKKKIGTQCLGLFKLWANTEIWQGIKACCVTWYSDSCCDGSFSPPTGATKQIWNAKARFPPKYFINITCVEVRELRLLIPPATPSQPLRTKQQRSCTERVSEGIRGFHLLAGAWKISPKMCWCVFFEIFWRGKIPIAFQGNASMKWQHASVWRSPDTAKFVWTPTSGKSPAVQ